MLGTIAGFNVTINSNKSHLMLMVRMNAWKTGSHN